MFSSDSSQLATKHLPPRRVQTGGFGDPEGLPGQGDPKRNTVTVARLGSFDLPSGPGRGNGGDGSHGVSGTIRAAGFGDATASPVVVASDGKLATSAFGDVTSQTSASAVQPVQSTPRIEPVQITYKPRPSYTPEALRLRVEGEVLLDVVFTASGSLRVNRVVKGLGYGLDDMALAAAHQIHFRPALRDGQPCDYVALVHIRFELAE